MSTYTVILTDRRDDGKIDPESHLCGGVSLREALNRVRAYAVQQTEANLTGVLIVQDGERPKLTLKADTLYLVLARLAAERDDQACPVLLCATRALAEKFVADEIAASRDETMTVEAWKAAGEPGPGDRTLFDIVEMPVVTALGVDAAAPVAVDPAETETAPVVPEDAPREVPDVD